MSRSRGATSQKTGFNPSFIYGEFATIKNQAEINRYNTGAESVPEATDEEFSVVQQDALFESDFDQFIKQLSKTGDKS